MYNFFLENIHIYIDNLLLRLKYTILKNILFL